MSIYFDRYSKFRVGNEIKPLPGIQIPINSSDRYVIYKQGETRLDILSNSYYNNPYSGWLIMLANPEFGGLEFNIPDSTTIRIPYPFDSGINRYITQITKHKTFYGI